MKLEETCACGASFSAEGDGVMKLWREWKRAHICSEKIQEAGDVILTSGSAQVEQAPLGFAPTELPGRQDWAIDDA